MHDLPIEIINYCLLFADTGTKIVYNTKKRVLEFTYDFMHNKYYSLLRLLSQREIQNNVDENITHIHLPWLFVSSSNCYQKFFSANITIYDDNRHYLWNSQNIYIKNGEKKDDVRYISYSSF